MSYKNKPSWLVNAIFYAIYPQSFYDTNADGIGDLQGIIEKLPYIESLGCNAIWIHPCFISPFNDAGYDVADFCRIAPRYGTNADMKRLLKAAHKIGIKVCLDLVAGHTSTEHHWFKESCKAESNEFSNRYIWNDSWCSDSDGMPAIRGYSQRAASYITNFFWSQPALNYGFAKPNPKCPWQLPVDHPDCIATRDALKEVIRFWLDMGVDGYRVDMASSLIKKDPDNKETIKLWQDIFSEVQTEYPEAVWISEWFENVKAIEAGYHIDFATIFSADSYQMLFRAEEKANLHYTSGHEKFSKVGDSYFAKAGKGDASIYIKDMSRILKKISGNGYIGHFTSNHDITRINVNRNQKEIELVFAFIFTIPGVPFIYYGDEIGMRYMGELLDKEGGYTRTGSRTPMQWTAGRNAGFSAGKELYLPIDEKKNAPNVEKQEGISRSLLNAVRKLTTLRNEVPAFQADGDFETILAEKNVYPLVYIRRKGDSKVLVVINPSGNVTRSTVKFAGLKDTPKKLLGSGVAVNQKSDHYEIITKAVTYAIFDI